MTEYWLLLLIPITLLGTLGALHRLGIPLPEWLDFVGEYAWYGGAFLVGFMTLGLIGRGRGKGGKGKLTAGDLSEDQTDAIDDQTTEDIENAPDEPDDDYAADAGDVVQDAADEADAELGDGFQPERPDDGLHPDLLPVDFDDS